MSKTIIFFLPFIILIGCSSKGKRDIPKNIKNRDQLTVFSADEEPVYSIKFVREISFGSTGDNLMGRIGGIAVDESGGVFIGDPDQYTIHIFKPDGSYLTHIGREGRGPNEFISSPSPTIISNKLYVFDFMQFRLSTYSLDSLTISHTLNLNPRNLSDFKELAGFYPAKIFFRNDNKFLVSFGQSVHADPTLSGYNADSLYNLYYLIDNKGRIISDKILKQKTLVHLSATVGGEYRSATGFPFVGESLIDVSEDGYIFSAWSEDFLIEIRNPSGEYLRAFYYPYNNVKLTRESALRITDIEYRQGIIQRANLPEAWPALHTMLIDDENRLWVATIVADQDVYRWWVLDASDGHLLARFTWPRDKPIEVVQGGKLYTRETDKESSLEEIVRYDITMTGR